MALWAADSDEDASPAPNPDRKGGAQDSVFNGVVAREVRAAGVREQAPGAPPLAADLDVFKAGGEPWQLPTLTDAGIQAALPLERTA